MFYKISILLKSYNYYALNNKPFLTLIFGLLYIQNTNAQADLGSWNILSIKYSIHKKWSAFGEAQVRSLKLYDNFHYYEYKAGINYNIYKNVNLALGAGSYQTYKEGGDFVLPKNNDEFRLWPQLILNQSIGRLKVEQRYRAEMRFTSNGFRNRYRSRLGVAYPFGQEHYGFRPFLVTINNEIFFTNREPYFERNRALIALSYKPSKATAIQIGYLSQFDYKINDETGTDFLVIGLSFDILRKDKK